MKAPFLMGSFMKALRFMVTPTNMVRSFTTKEAFSTAVQSP